MTKLLSYNLSGQGVTPAKSIIFINLLKQSGVKFPPRPSFGNTGGKLYFHPIEPVGKKTEQDFLALLERCGVKKAKLERCGNYVSK
jgi:hypothetical protein